MTIIKKLALSALALAALAGSAHAAAPAAPPAPTPLSRTEMTNIRGEGSTYISYGALGKNNVPCSKRGLSYYNCQPGAQANPYTRGCSVISRCARQ